MRVLGGVVGVLVALALPATAQGPGTLCTVLTDAAGDVAVAGAPQASGIPDGQVDVLSVEARVVRTGLELRVNVTELDRARRGAWRVTFSSNGQRVFAEAAAGIWGNVGTATGGAGFFAGVAGRRPTKVTGSFDYAASQIVISVPSRVLGAAAPGPGSTLSGFVVDTSETLLNLDPSPGSPASRQVGISDHGESSTRYYVGRGCA